MDLASLAGHEFWKMSGSGNDFVFFDARTGPSAAFERPDVIQAICDRRKGVGADGIVLLKNGEPPASVFIRYFNSDGSLASLCGNATLCATRLTAIIGAASGPDFSIGTDAGLVQARLVGGDPEIDLQPITGLEPDFPTPLEAGERRLGFADSGVPHLVVLVDDVERVALEVRGARLRRLRELESGANVNFVSGAPGQWWMRTYERGVEAETLACGTGSVATASLLRAWGLESGDVRITTRSGRDQRVRMREHGGSWLPSLQGEGRVVFSGRLGDLGSG